MWDGQLIFRRELVGAARRAGYYRLRVACMVAILAVLAVWVPWQQFQSRAGSVGGRPFVSPQSLGSLAADAFVGTIASLVFVVLSLAPSFMAGVVVEEKQQRTLPELLTTQLEPFSILWPKLLALLMQVGILVGLAVPFLVFTATLADIKGWFVALVLTMVASTSYFVGGCAILASTVSQRLNEAIFASYALAVGILVIPSLLLDGLVLIVLPGVIPYRLELEFYLAWLLWVSPVSFWAQYQFGWLPEEWLTTRLLALIGLQLVYGTALVGLSAALLRPINARQQGESRSASRRSRPLLPRPRVFGNPVAWKEIFAAPPGGLGARLVQLAILVGAVWLLIRGWQWYFGPAFAFTYPGIAPWLDGFGFGMAPLDPRPAAHTYLEQFFRFATLIWLMGVVVVVTDGWIRERLQDTWVTLLSTPLSGPELIRGKALGCVVRLWPIAVAFLVTETLAVSSGIVHPVGALLRWITLAAITWLAALAATFFAVLVRSRPSIIIIGALGLSLLLVFGRRLPVDAQSFFKPDAVIASLGISWRDWNELIQRSDWLLQAQGRFLVDRITDYRHGLVIAIVYVGLAVFATVVMFNEFDALIDRPRRSAQPPTRTNGASRAATQTAFPNAGATPIPVISQSSNSPTTLISASPLLVAPPSSSPSPLTIDAEAAVTPAPPPMSNPSPPPVSR